MLFAFAWLKPGNQGHKPELLYCFCFCMAKARGGLRRGNPSLSEKASAFAEAFVIGAVISRVLYLLRGDDHLSGRTVTSRLKRPTRISNKYEPHLAEVTPSGFLLGLAPDEVYIATPVTSSAVSSYLAISPLPACAGGIISVALSIAFPRLDVIQHPALWCPDFPPV